MPVMDKPASDKPAGKKPGSDKPGSDKPGSDKWGSDKPGSDHANALPQNRAEPDAAPPAAKGKAQAPPPKTRLWIGGAAVATIFAGVGIAGALTHGFGLWAPPSTVLTLFGNVDIREVSLGFRIAGRIAAMPVDEGEHVEPGALLASLDAQPMRDRLASSQAHTDASAAALAKRLAGNRTQDIAGAEADLAQRRAVSEGARRDYERRRPLLASGAVTKESADQTEAAYRSAQANTRAAEQALSLQRAGARTEDVDAARADLASTAADRDAATTDLADTRLLAPSPGTILTRAREPGAIVAAGETVFTLTIDRPLRVRAYVAEPYLGRVRPGMAVTVQADGATRPYRGTVGYIAAAAEFTPKTVETTSLRADLVYRLRIIVTDPDDGLRQGQPVTVTIETASSGQ